MNGRRFLADGAADFCGSPAKRPYLYARSAGALLGYDRTHLPRVGSCLENKPGQPSYAPLAYGPGALWVHAADARPCVDRSPMICKLGERQVDRGNDPLLDQCVERRAGRDASPAKSNLRPQHARWQRASGMAVSPSACKTLPTPGVLPSDISYNASTS